MTPTSGRADGAGRVARLAVFGGSFNPPHRGHQELVALLLERGLADEVGVVPVYDHPFGKELAPFADRLAMCELAFAGDPRVRVSPIERRLGGPSYTVRTLEALRDERPGDRLLLVVGADALRDVRHWHDFDRVRTLAELLVVPRRGQPSEEALDLPAPADVSSSDIRRRVAAGEPIADRVSPAVESYIRSHGLYLHPGGAAAAGRDRGDGPSTPPSGDER